MDTEERRNRHSQFKIIWATKIITKDASLYCLEQHRFNIYKVMIEKECIRKLWDFTGRWRRRHCLRLREGDAEFDVGRNFFTRTNWPMEEVLSGCHFPYVSDTTQLTTICLSLLVFATWRLSRQQRWQLAQRVLWFHASSDRLKRTKCILHNLHLTNGLPAARQITHDQQWIL